MFILHFYGVAVCKLEMLDKASIYAQGGFFTRKVTLYHSTAAWEKIFFNLN